MIGTFNDLLSRQSASSASNARARSPEAHVEPGAMPPSTPPGSKVSPARVPGASTPRITRDTIIKFRGIFGPIMKIPKEFRDEFPCYSPSNPSTMDLVRDWMDKRQFAATSASNNKDKLVDCDQFVLASPDQLSPSPSATLPAPPLLLSAVSSHSRNTKGKTLSMIRKGKYVEREEPSSQSAGILQMGRV